MTNIELQVKQWQQNTFGSVNVPATYKKLLEEIGELGEALMRQDPKEIEEEAGDVTMVLMILAQATCKDVPSLTGLAALALDKCERRRYAKQGGKHQSSEGDRFIGMSVEELEGSDGGSRAGLVDY